MCLSSDNLKMPCLKTSFESLAPIMATRYHVLNSGVGRERWRVYVRETGIGVCGVLGRSTLAAPQSGRSGQLSGVSPRNFAG